MAYRPLKNAAAPAVIVLRCAAGDVEVHAAMDVAKEVALLVARGDMMLSIPLPRDLTQSRFLYVMQEVARLAKAGDWENAVLVVDEVARQRLGAMSLSRWVAQDGKQVRDSLAVPETWKLAEVMAGCILGGAAPQAQELLEEAFSVRNPDADVSVRAEDFFEVVGNAMAGMSEKVGIEYLKKSCPEIFELIARDAQICAERARAQARFGRLSTGCNEH